MHFFSLFPRKMGFSLGKWTFFPLTNVFFHSETLVFPLENTFWTAFQPPDTDKSCMNSQASFKQILREKMGDTPSQADSKFGTFDSDPANLAYLIGLQRRMDLNLVRGHYPKSKTPPPQRKAHAFTETQLDAYKYIKMWIVDLSEGFTAHELKRAFRKAALILHPDKGGKTEDFLALKRHYELLRPLVASI